MPDYFSRAKIFFINFAWNRAKNGALLIFDEVMTGFRVARGGAQHFYGIRPDLTALGKVIGGGLPVGAFGGRAEIMDCLSPDGPVYQAGTLSGNPLAMAAGLAQLRELERIDGWKLLEHLGAQLEERIGDAISKAALTFHRIGSMFCLFFTNGPVVDLDSAQTQRYATFRAILSCMSGARDLFRAVTIRDRILFPRRIQRADIEETAKVMRETLANL